METSRISFKCILAVLNEPCKDKAAFVGWRAETSVENHRGSAQLWNYFASYVRLEKQVGEPR